MRYAKLRETLQNQGRVALFGSDVAPENEGEIEQECTPTAEGEYYALIHERLETRERIFGSVMDD